MEVEAGGAHLQRFVRSLPTLDDVVRSNTVVDKEIFASTAIKAVGSSAAIKGVVASTTKKKKEVIPFTSIGGVISITTEDLIIPAEAVGKDRAVGFVYRRLYEVNAFGAIDNDRA